METKVLEEEKGLRDLILRLSDGLTVYGEVNRNFVPIKVSFSQCAYMTAITGPGPGDSTAPESACLLSISFR
jgi:hypothetical protein